MRVDVAAIETELARIQRELTQSEVRTSLFNLVVFSANAQRTMADETLNFLLGKRAARVIHIVPADDAESSIDVSARCFVDGQHKGVCFQEIVISNGRDGAGGAPGSWIPLLIRDIPTYVLWLDRVLDNVELLAHAHDQADKLILDSEHSVELGDDPKALFLLLRDRIASGLPVSDFAWRRLRSARQALAGAFDPRDRRPWLEEIAGMTLAGWSRPATWLMGLWLAERLGWAPTGFPRTDGTVQFTDRVGRTITVSARPAQACEFSAEATTFGGGTVTVISSDGCVDIEDSDGSTEHRQIAFPDSGTILLEEVDSLHPDELYRAAMLLLANRERESGIRVDH